MEESPVVTPRKALVIHSPHSGRSDQLDEALAGLAEAGIHVVETHSIADSITLHDKDIDLVIAAGGDGLIGGVVALIAGGELPLGILPLGTSNNLARAAQIPQDIAQAVTCIAEGHVKKLDLGQIEYPERPHEPRRLFAQALTFGLHVQFSTLATDKEQRERLGPLNYPVAIAETLKDFQPIEVELTFEGLYRPTDTGDEEVQESTLRCRAAQVTIANADVFWGALEATLPGTTDSLRDRLLEIIVIEDARLDQLVFRVGRFFGRDEHTTPTDDAWHAQYPELLSAQLTDIPGIHHLKARAVSLKISEQDCEGALDGEVCVQPPVWASVARERLALIVPAKTSEEA